MNTLTVGSFAYFDTFAGLIPCKVLAITGKSGNASSAQNVTFKLTANRGAYRRGEVLQAWSLHVVPRKAIRGKYRNRIGHYTVEV